MNVSTAANLSTSKPAGAPAPGAGEGAPAGVSRFMAQRMALEQVMGLSTTCATEYRRLEEQRGRALAAAQADHAHEEAAIQASFTTERTRILEAAASAIARHRRVFEEDREGFEGQAGAERSELDRREKSTRKKLEKEHSDATWLIDTMLEGETARIDEANRAVLTAIKEDARRLDELATTAVVLFARYGQSLPPVSAIEPKDQPVAPSTEALEQALEQRRAGVEQNLAAMQRLIAPRMFLGSVPWVMAGTLVLLGALVGRVLTAPLTVDGVLQAPPNWQAIGGGAALAAVLAGAAWWWLRGVALKRLNEAGRRFVESLSEAQQAAQADRKGMKHGFDEQLLDAKLKHAQEMNAANARNQRKLLAARTEYETQLAKISQDRESATAQANRLRDSAVAEAEARRDREHAEAKDHRQQQLAASEQKRQEAIAAAERAYQQGREELVNRWSRALQITRDLSDESDRPEFAAIDDWRAWRPPRTFAPTVRFGELAVDMRRFTGEAREAGDGQVIIGGSNGDGLRLPMPEPYTVPALLAFPDFANLLIRYEPEGREAAVATLRLTMLRLLTSLPAGRVQFTLIDPVGLGRSFAGFMHLADFDEDLVGGRVWTEPEAIEQRLTDLTEHMETVIQKYLRNEFETIDAYNAQAGELAEPYRFVVIADLPTGFSERALTRLSSIAASGARCGVHVLSALDVRHASRGSEPVLEDLERNCSVLVYEKTDIRDQGSEVRGFRWEDPTFGRLPLTLDTPPDESSLTDVLRVLGQAARDAKRVEVPFTSIAPADGQMWSQDSASDLHVPVGRTGATRLQTFRLGRGVAQHALIAGKTGSGKSTLLNVLITNFALWYAPDQLELYLIDFKRGVEFMAYATARLPHARAVAVETDREFGLSVLGRLDEELARRGDLFRAAGVQDIAAYRRATGRAQPDPGPNASKDQPSGHGSASGRPVALPRVVLIVDEFQELFSEDDKLTQDASLLIDRLVRQGRAFGIHVILGSQTIGGQAGLGRATLGQMAVRVALQCTEADSQLILGDANTAARLLSRPGEAIYNDAGGAVENNSPFQISWLDDSQRDALLHGLRQRADREGVKTRPPVVFEGNAPAKLGENEELRAALAGKPARKYAVYLGDPVAIKEPTHVLLRRQAGSNIVVIGQQEENIFGAVASALISLSATAARSAAGKAILPRFVVLDGTPRDTPRAQYLADVASKLPAKVDFVDYRAVPDAFADLADELRERIESGATDAPPTILIINGIQRYRNLTRGDDFSFSEPSPRSGSLADILDDDADASGAPRRASVRPEQVLMDLVREGPMVGMHVILTADTLASLERRLGRDTLREFDARVLFQMSGNDSSVLLDSLAASRLGFYRALVASEEMGTVEKFRPYAPPEGAALDELTRALK